MRSLGPKISELLLTPANVNTLAATKAFGVKINWPKIQMIMFRSNPLGMKSHDPEEIPASLFSIRKA